MKNLFSALQAKILRNSREKSEENSLLFKDNKSLSFFKEK